MAQGFHNSGLALNLRGIQLESLIETGIGKSNKILSRLQRTRVFDLLKVSESETHNLDTEISQVHEHLSSLVTKRARCRAHTKKLRIAIAPHKYLPPELLAEVFLHCLHHGPLDGRLGILRPSPRPLPAPWVLGHVCSRWRQIALGEKRLWNSIYYEGNSQRHVLLLKEAFRRSGQSTLQLEARESGAKLYKPFLREVIRPELRRITSLFLDIAETTFSNFLMLPSGLVDELECVKIQLCHGHGYLSPPPATVFQMAPRLQRVTIPLLASHSVLDLALPWDQLTYLALTHGNIELTDSFKVLSLCTNLCECHLSPLPDIKPSPVFPPPSIQLPHLRKLGLNMSREPLYGDFFRPLVIPKLEQFAFLLSDPSEDHLKELRETIDHLSIPDLGLELDYDGSEGDGIMRLAHSLPPLTSIKAYAYDFPASTMELIGHETCFQTLTSLEIITRSLHTKALVEMFKAHWARARQSNNNHTGIQFATIEVFGIGGDHISKVSRDIAMIQKQLGVADANITLRKWAPGGRPWLF